MLWAQDQVPLSFTPLCLGSYQHLQYRFNTPLLSSPRQMYSIHLGNP